MDHQVGKELAEIVGRPVVAAGLKQQNPGAAVGREAVGQDATGRAGSHDDEISCNVVGHVVAFPQTVVST